MHSAADKKQIIASNKHRLWLCRSCGVWPSFSSLLKSEVEYRPKNECEFSSVRMNRIIFLLVELVLSAFNHFDRVHVRHFHAEVTSSCYWFQIFTNFIAVRHLESIDVIDGKMGLAQFRNAFLDRLQPLTSVQFNRRLLRPIQWFRSLKHKRNETMIIAVFVWCSQHAAGLSHR